MSTKPLVSVTAGCYNEEDNVFPLYERIVNVFGGLPQYDFEIIFIDNHSFDDTVPKVREIIARDPRVRLIINSRNFGHLRSPYYGFLQGRGDVVVSMASDLEDPPELIPEFLEKWEEGYKIVAGVKKSSQETKIMWLIRQSYYKTLERIADIKVIPNFTGFGLYDQKVVKICRSLEDPNPYFRGIISEIGFDVAQVAFVKPIRVRGITKNNFYTLYDTAMLGITSHSKVPLRLATMGGFVLAFLSLLVSCFYLTLKLMFWQRFSLGMAPMVIGIFFFSSVQLFFIGLLGEYVLAIHTQVVKRPHVVEQERVNFDEKN